MQEKVYFKNPSGQRLAGVIDRDESRATQPLVMIFGGFNSYKYSTRQEDLAQFFNSLGFATFRFDYRGRGESEGNISYATFTSGLEDTKSAVDFMKNQLWVDINNIGIFGADIGADFAIFEALKSDRYKFLLLGAPRPNLLSLFKGANPDDWRDKDFYYSNGINYHISIYDDSLKYDIYEEAKKLDIPTLIITGEGDEIHELGQDKKLKKAIKDSQMILVKECNNVYCVEAK